MHFAIIQILKMMATPEATRVVLPADPTPTHYELVLTTDVEARSFACSCSRSNPISKYHRRDSSFVASPFDLDGRGPTVDQGWTRIPSSSIPAVGHQKAPLILLNRPPCTTCHALSFIFV